MERSLLGQPARFPRGVHEVADGVLAWLQPNGGWGESNSVAIRGEGEAALVDTLWTPGLTWAMLAELRPRLGVPIHTIINTHSDGDHVWGNEAVGGATIIATEAAAQIIGEEPPSSLQRMRRLAALLAPLPRVGELGRYLRWMLGPYDFSHVHLTPPNREFSGYLGVTVGGRELRLIEVGPAHTPGDLIVHVPDADVVIAADILFVGCHPIMWAGPVANWVAALERIAELRPVVVIPGHGPVGSVADLERLREYFEWLEAAALPRLSEGAGVHELAVELARQARADGAVWAEWDGPERMVITLATIDRHRRGQAGRVDARARARLFGGLARAARELGTGPWCRRGSSVRG